MKKSISFIDEVKIKLKAGNGGQGIASFHREKYVDKGGPDGGNGGRGGNIYLKANENINTLLLFRGKKIFAAENGKNGGSNNKTGRSGKDLFIEVPIGTEIINNNKIESDLYFNDQMILIARGGRGGRGNASFKSSKNHTPSLHENGEKGEEKELILNLKVLADVGLLGYPNAGKSTFLSVVSNAKPKIDSYAFTTLAPKLGLIKEKNYTYVITDLPGLIDGASENKGMGIEFLKHLSRTKIIAHLIDASLEDYLEKYKSLRKELKNYSKDLFSKDEIIIFTKLDLIDEDKIKKIRKDFDEQKIFFISSIRKENTKNVLTFLGKKLEEIKIKEKEELNEKIKEEDYTLIKLKESKEIDNSFEIEKDDNTWIIAGKYLEYWANKIPLDTHENYLRMWSKLNSIGVIKELKKQGIKNNDIVVIKNTKISFEFKEKPF